MKIKISLPEFLTETSVTSFGDHVYRPRWFSVLSDLTCLFSLGLFRPTRRPGEKCDGDILRYDYDSNIQ